MCFLLALKAEASHLGTRTSDALEAIREAEALVERSGERWWCAELHRLRGVFLTALGADETHIEARCESTVEMGVEEQSLTADDQLFVLTQAGSARVASQSAVLFSFWCRQQKTTGIEIRFDPHRTNMLQLALPSHVPSHVIRRRFEYQIQGSFGRSEETGLRN